jgi:uncharacterized protein (DUF1697 family)
MPQNSKIALLRGINVGGKNKLKMADLKDSLAVAGLNDVRTYIQSGNICFDSKLPRKKLEALIMDTIAADFGYSVSVMVRDQKFFQNLIKSSPYCKSGKPKVDIAELHVTLLAKKPLASAVATMAELDFADQYEVVNDVVFLRITSGYSKTKLTNGFLEKKLGVAATSRNWKTVCKLVEM